MGLAEIIGSDSHPVLPQCSLLQNIRENRRLLIRPLLHSFHHKDQAIIVFRQAMFSGGESVLVFAGGPEALKRQIR
jgi:hypothetical protein